MVHDLHYRVHGASFRVVCSVYEAANTSMNQRARAHGARFNCNKQIAVSQAVVTNGSTSLTQGDDLGVAGGIRIADVAIPSAADDTAITHDDRAYWHFSGLKRPLGAPQGFFHPKLVGMGFIRKSFVQNRRRSWVFGLRMGCSRR